jgi:hypothetical protein
VTRHGLIVGSVRDFTTESVRGNDELDRVEARTMGRDSEGERVV